MPLLIIDGDRLTINSKVIATSKTEEDVARSYPLDQIRNIGIIAHIDAGKTTVTERILFYTGVTYKIGQVDEGTAVMDWMEQEKARGITITAAATTCYWRDHRINIIDTPGHVDFTAEVERSLRVLDGGVVVFDAVSGVEAQSEVVWRQANKYHVPRICFINKMDRVGADFEMSLSTIERRLKAIPLVLHLPIGSEAAFEGIIDVVENRALRFKDTGAGTEVVESPVPESEQSRTIKQRELLVERLAELDDQILGAYLGGDEITPADIKQALRRVTIANKGVPVLCGTALRSMGIQPLLDAVADYLPSPLDMPPVRGIDKTGTETFRPARDDAPFSALAFKVVSDPFMGRLVYIRVYSGRINAGAQVYNSTQDKRERIGRLLLMHANRREELEETDTGSIVAVIGLKNTFTGDTLCSPAQPIVLESIRFPEPVISVAIEPRTRADQDRMGEALHKLAEEDPTFKVSYNEETGQTVISGMGELHLDVLVQRLLSEFKVGANVGKPRVAYKETILAPVKGDGRFVRQSGGRGQYGHAVIELAPSDKGTGFEFIDHVKAGAIPKQFITPVQAGIKEALEGGALAGYPVIDVRATLLDGSYHEVDSTELAFKIAGSLAAKEALSRARLILLEPIMRLEVVTPEEFLGDIIGDLNARRGRIEHIETHGDICTIRTQVPLAEAFGYSSTLRSLTQGRGVYSMEFYRYEEAPAEVVSQVKAIGR